MSPASAELRREPTAVHLMMREVEKYPDALALMIPRSWSDGRVTDSERVSFRELWERASEFAHGLDAEGFEVGDRVLVAAPLSVDLYALLVAFSARGVCAVFVDASARSKGAIAHAVRAARPKAMISPSRLARYRFLLRGLWGARAYTVDGPALGARALSSLRRSGRPMEPYELPRETEAIITFTSGSTGRPKGVVRTHGVALGQHHAVATRDPLPRGSIHMTTFPVFALHDLCCGVGTVLPALDPLRPHDIDAGAIVSQLIEHDVGCISAPPAFVEALADELIARRLQLPALREVWTGAAPVGPQLCEKLLRAFGPAHVSVLYGSTEAEPISKIDARSVASEPGPGYLVGKKAPTGELALARLPKGEATLGPEGLAPHLVAQGEQGEILVRGAHVVDHYLGDPESQRKLKLRDPDGGVWHRTLDLGFVDDQGRIWLTGRVPDLIERHGVTVSPLPIEARVEALPEVRRAALVSHEKAPHGELLVQLNDGAAPEQARAKLSALLDAPSLTDLPIVFVDAIALDPRHFSKLDRPTIRKQREAT